MEIHKLMSAQELANYLGLTYGHIRRLLLERPDQLPPYIQITETRKRWKIEDVDKWLEERKHANETEIN